MDLLTEKKWFVYLGDHHEGPFSVAELQEKLTQGQLSLESYAWTEGMADWKPLPDIPDLGSFLKNSSPPPDATPTLAEAESSIPSMELAALQVEAQAPSGEASPEKLNLASEQIQEITPEVYIQEVRPSLQATDEKTGELDVNELKATQALAKKRSFPKITLPAGKVFKFAFILGALGGGAFLCFQFKADLQKLTTPLQPFLLLIAEKVPALENWISPIPSLEDVSPDEYENLKTAVRVDSEKTNTRFALAISKANPLAPHFYISSRLPDGAKFRVHLIGIPETLLNQLTAEAAVEATLNKKLAQTPPVMAAEGKNLPRGEYLVYLTASDDQPSSIKSIIQSWYHPVDLPPGISKEEKVILYRTYFLGGSKDAIYVSRLKTFHDKLREKTNDELKEINQFANTLQNQLTSSLAQFDLLKKGKPGSKQKKEWEKFHTTWLELENQLDSIFQKWTPQGIRNEYFYDMLYSLIQQIGFEVKKIHDFHTSFFNGVTDLKTFEIQLGEATSSCQNELNLLRAKIDQASKLPPTTNGMPTKEGL